MYEFPVILFRANQGISLQVRPNKREIPSYAPGAGKATSFVYPQSDQSPTFSEAGAARTTRRRFLLTFFSARWAEASRSCAVASKARRSDPRNHGKRPS